MRRKMTADKIHAQLDKLRRKANVSAYVILLKGEHVGTVRLSWPRDGAGRLTALAADWTRTKPDDVEFRQWTRWQYGTATGCGYDKATAALSGMTIAGITIHDDGYRWANQLEAANLTVIEAV